MTDKAAQFKALHVPGDPLILFNIWDAGSAKAVAAAGAKAIATGSFAVAEARGAKDGETLSFADAEANLRQILAATDLPVTVDVESGYSETATGVRLNMIALRRTGAAGINIEDRMPGKTELIKIADQVARLSAAAETGLFVNARCDVFRGQDVKADGKALVAAAVQRAKAYAVGGASGFFVPFLSDRDHIAAICDQSPLPVNILWTPACGDHAALAKLGVARISHGHQPWAAAMAWLGQQASAVFAGHVPPYAR